MHWCFTMLRYYNCYRNSYLICGLTLLFIRNVEEFFLCFLCIETNAIGVSSRIGDEFPFLDKISITRVIHISCIIKSIRHFVQANMWKDNSTLSRLTCFRIITDKGYIDVSLKCAKRKLFIFVSQIDGLFLFYAQKFFFLFKIILGNTRV